MGYIFFKSQSIETLFITFFFPKNLNLYVNVYCVTINISILSIMVIKIYYVVKFNQEFLSYFM